MCVWFKADMLCLLVLLSCYELYNALSRKIDGNNVGQGVLYLLLHKAEEGRLQ